MVGLLSRAFLSAARSLSRGKKFQEKPSRPGKTRPHVSGLFLKAEIFFLHISLSSSLVPRRSLLTRFSARSVTSQFTVESMIDLAENVRGYAAFRLFVYTHILVLRASWGPEHENQEALPGGTEDLESWAQLFEGRLALNLGLNLTRVSFSFIQKHFLG